MMCIKRRDATKSLFFALSNDLLFEAEAVDESHDAVKK